MYIDWDELMEQKREHAEALFDEAKELVSAHEATITTETAVGRPDRAILEYVEENDVDRVFVGSHGRWASHACCWAASPKPSSAEP
jgi:nucleotide-binding universal stress UspA family protein